MNVWKLRRLLKPNAIKRSTRRPWTSRGWCTNSNSKLSRPRLSSRSAKPNSVSNRNSSSSVSLSNSAKNNSVSNNNKSRKLT